MSIKRAPRNTKTGTGNKKTAPRSAGRTLDEFLLQAADEDDDEEEEDEEGEDVEEDEEEPEEEESEGDDSEDDSGEEPEEEESEGDDEEEEGGEESGDDSEDEDDDFDLDDLDLDDLDLGDDEEDDEKDAAGEDDLDSDDDDSFFGDDDEFGDDEEPASDEEEEGEDDEDFEAALMADLDFGDEDDELNPAPADDSMGEEPIEEPVDDGFEDHAEPDGDEAVQQPATGMNPVPTGDMQRMHEDDLGLEEITDEDLGIDEPLQNKGVDSRMMDDAHRWDGGSEGTGALPVGAEDEDEDGVVLNEEYMPNQKPTKLDPAAPTMFGPPPDAGFSYGAYQCKACKTAALIPAAKVGKKGMEKLVSGSAHCPVCSQKMAAVNVNPKSEKRVAKAIKSVKASQFTVLGSCSKHGDLGSTTLKRASWCCFCGEALKSAATKKTPVVKKASTSKALTASVVNPASLKNASADDVSLVLHEADTKDPYYTVFHSGLPLAQIRFADQEGKNRPAREWFTSPNYVDALLHAASQGGDSLTDTLNTQNARYFQASVEASELAKQVRADVLREVEGQVRQERLAAQDKFLKAMAYSVIGLNKNFFPDCGNPLKAAFVDELERVGVRNPIQVITNAFARDNGQFFKAAVAKANMLLELEPAARKQLIAALMQSNEILDDIVEAEAEDMPTSAADWDNYSNLKTRMAATSNPLTSYAGLDPNQGVGSLAEQVRRIFPRGTAVRNR